MSEAEPASAPFVSGLILAAGSSSRMGRPKQLLPLGEKCLLQRLIDQALESRLDEVVVVLGHRASEILAALKPPSASRARFTVNEDYAQGMSTSLIAGLRALDPRAAVAAVILGDQPRVGAPLIDLTIAGFLASDRSMARPVYVSRGGGVPVKVPGHPVLLARGVWREVESLRGDEGARALFESDPERLLEIAVEAGPFEDIDTPQDYERALESLALCGDS